MQSSPDVVPDEIDSSQFVSNEELRIMVDSSFPVIQTQIETLKRIYSLEGSNYPISSYCKITSKRKESNRSFWSAEKK